MNVVVEVSENDGDSIESAAKKKYGIFYNVAYMYNETV